MLTWKPCEAHQKTHRPCPTTCKDGKWVPVESKQTACDTCVARKKKCTHGLGGPKEAEIKREPDLATYQKPAGGKTKRVQEEKPTSNKVSNKPASGGKTKRMQEEKPTSNKVSKEPALGGKGAVDEEPFAFEEELDLNFWDDKKEYDAFKVEESAAGGKGAVEKERVPEEHESGLNFWYDKEEYDAFKAGLRDMLANDDLR